jgi:hypothetical protein
MLLRWKTFNAVYLRHAGFRAKVQRPTESGQGDGNGSDNRPYPGNSVQSKPAVENNASKVSAPSAAHVERSNIEGRGKVRSAFSLIHYTQL